MKPRTLAFLLTLIAAFFAAPTSAESGAEAWQSPRMSWGVPDLQGTWTNATITGLERPFQLRTLVLTPQEASGVENWTADFYTAIDKLPEGPLKAGADVGGYNTFWMDPGSRLARVGGEIRSSLIVDPSDGKIPYSCTAEPCFQNA